MDGNKKSKPLVYLVLASVVAAIVLVFAIGDRLRSPEQTESAQTGSGQVEPADQQASQQPAGDQQQSAGQPAPASESDASDTSARQATDGDAATAAIEPDQQPAGQQPATEQSEPGKPDVVDSPATGKPTFDIVRIEGDGGAVIAGRAAPGSRITLRFGDAVIGEAVANERGEWVVTPDQALPKGAHNLTISAEASDGTVTQSDQVVSVSVPADNDDQPLIVLAETEKPTRVLQKPQPAEQPDADAGTTDAGTTADATGPEQTGAGQSTIAAVEPDVDAPPAQQESQEDTDTAEQQQTGQSAEQQQSDQPVAGTEQAEPETAPAKSARLVLSAVDYNDTGDILFSGTAAPGEAVRVYVDNEYVGEAIADAAGNWLFRGQENIKPGVHSLRIDQVGKDGKVAQRRELPFERARPERVAAMNQPRSADTTETAQGDGSTTEPAGSQQATNSASSQEQSTEPAQPLSQTSQSTQTAGASSQAATEEPSDTDTQMAATDTDLGMKGSVSEPAPDQAGTPKKGHVVIQPGNNLWNISRVIYGRGIEYTVIYEANKEQIRNPHRIYPGQIFNTPGVTPPEDIDPRRRTPLNDGSSAQ